MVAVEYLATTDGLVDDEESVVVVGGGGGGNDGGFAKDAWILLPSFDACFL